MKPTTFSNSSIWDFSPQLSASTREILSRASAAIQNWLILPISNGKFSGETSLTLFGQVKWKPSNFIWRKAGFHHVEFQTIFIDPVLINIDMAVHEYAHVLDNFYGTHQLATIFGGGPADDMLRALCANPDLFLPRFRAIGYEHYLRDAGIELNPTTYGRTCGPAEDFAEGFRLAVLHPELLKTAAPRRYQWFDIWRRHILMSGQVE